MSGVTIMILIILLITILMSYVLYCDTDPNPDLVSIADKMVTNLMSPSVILTDPECQDIKGPEPFQVSNIYRFLLNIHQESAVFVSLSPAGNICSLVWIVSPGSPGLW